MATNRGFKIITDGIYHVFNRGVERRPVFMNSKGYQRFIDALWFYGFPQQMRLSYFYKLSVAEQQNVRHSFENPKDSKIISLLAYCLMPNHFHLLLRQDKENGVTNFLANTTNSYTKYFNTKHKRPGPLFQGPFKAVRIETDEQLLHISRYIHINPVVSGIITEAQLYSYPWSSFPEYEGNSSFSLCDKTWITEFFSSTTGYSQFVRDQIDYGKKIESIKHLTFEGGV